MKTKSIFLAAAMLLSLVAPPARAAVTEAWVQRYNNVVSNVNDHPFKVVSDAAGDFIVIGVASGLNENLAIKYSGANGFVIWQQRYKCLGNEFEGWINPGRVAVDGSGNLVVTGLIGPSEGDAYTAKYSAVDGVLLWEKSYSSGGYANAVAVDGSGNVVVTGSSESDYYTAKYAAADGALLWEKRYNGLANSWDSAQAVAVDGNGNVVVTGGSDSVAGADYYTAKYAAADGTLLWEQRYNGPDSHYAARAIALDGDGNVVVTGPSLINGQEGHYMAKYAAADGALSWEKRYDNPVKEDYSPWVLAVDGSGNVVLTGYSRNGSDSDYYTAKYAAVDGTLLWEKRYNGPASSTDYAWVVALDGSGNVVVTGSSDGNYHTVKYAAVDGALLWERRSVVGSAAALAPDVAGSVVVTGSSAGDYYTAKYAAADGALLWEKSLNGPPSNGSDVAHAVVVDASGNVVVTGSSESDFSTANYYTAKYAAADGSLRWEKRHADGAAQAVAVDGSGNVIVTGNSESAYYTTKYAAADGTLLWEKRSNWLPNNNAPTMAVDSSGNVVVTGSEYFTAKYGGSDGVLLWEKSYDSRGHAHSLAVDSNGNVVVTGVTWRGTGNGDLYTVKCAAANGAILWEKRYNGTANGADWASAMAVDSSGNVVVAGASWNGTSYDFYTAKYAAANGALVWEKRHTNGETSAVALDGGGNVVVTGFSGNWPDYDYSTVKYAAADGALLWERRYNSPASGTDLPEKIGVDARGDVVVTGTSEGDYYTAKYAAADGALLWEKRYNGPANGNDRVAGLALGPNGMVVVTGSSDGAFGPRDMSDYATIVYRESLSPISIALVPTGVRTRFPGVPGRTYNIERAFTITGPWNTIATPTAPIDGIIEYVDTSALTGATFYRTSTP